MTEIYQVKSLNIIENEITISEIQGAKIATGRQSPSHVIITGCKSLLANQIVYLAYTLSYINDKSFFKLHGYDYHIHFKCVEDINIPNYGLACFLVFCLLRGVKNKFKDISIAAMGELDLYGNVTKIPNLQTKINNAVDHIDDHIILLPTSDEKVKLKGRKVYQISNIEELFQFDDFHNSD